MHPIFRVVSLFGHERVLSSYGVLLAIAILVGTTISVRAMARAGFPFGDALATAGLVSAFGLLGAWALDGLVRFGATGSLRGAFSEVGLTFYGAPIGGAIAFVWACRVFEVPPLRMADAAIAGVPIAHALGRIGCFLAGCCYGRESHGRLAVVYTDPALETIERAVPRHPVQLYEAFALLVVGGFLVLRPPRRVGDGRRVLGYVATYAVLRLVTERFRGDAVRGFVGFGLSTSDAIAIATLALAGWAFVRLGRCTENRD